MPEGLSLASGETLDLPVPAPTPAEAESSYEAPPKREPVDPDAPHGRKANGEPKRGPGGRPAKHDKARATASPQGSSVDPGSRQATWVEGLAGVGQIAASGCLVAHQRIKDDVAFAADAIAITQGTTGLAKAIADAGAKDARVAKVLDSICAVGPWGALLTAGLGLGVQLAANHGVPAARMMGGLEPAVLISEFEKSDGPVHTA
ncbi:MAG: hypothetical protein ACREKE_05980 [bacterium]